jgi:hypothetical protein
VKKIEIPRLKKFKKEKKNCHKKKIKNNQHLKIRNHRADGNKRVSEFHADPVIFGSQKLIPDRSQ